MDASPPLESAVRTIADETAGWSKVRWAAWYLFNADRFDLARQGFERLIAIGREDDDVVAALAQIYSDEGEFANAALVITHHLEKRDPDFSPQQRLSWTANLFDTLSADPSCPARAHVTLRLLEAVAAGQTGDWAVILDTGRRDAIDSDLEDPSITLPGLEQLLYAPTETGLSTEAVGRIEAFGCRHAADSDLSRSAERLLHTFGHPEAAYRVEACRRVATRPAPPAKSQPAPSLPKRSFIVTVAGGHPALRSMAGRDLAAIGVVTLREIPSAWEATRDGRAIQATLSGSDLVIILARQIAHSTSDHVRAAASRLGIPIAYVDSASVSAIHRAVEDFATSLGKR